MCSFNTVIRVMRVAVLFAPSCSSSAIKSLVNSLYMTGRSYEPFSGFSKLHSITKCLFPCFSDIIAAFSKSLFSSCDSISFLITNYAILR